MIIDDVEIMHVRRRLEKPFRISVGEIDAREFLVLRGRGEGFTVYSEVNIDARPFYTSEFVASAQDVLVNDLLPPILGREVASAAQCQTFWRHVRGNAFAKAAVEALFWDLEGKCKGLSLAALIGATDRKRVEVGTSHSIFATPELLVEDVAAAVDAGISRVKLKIQPGWDLAPLAAVRAAFPDIRLMADANAAYDRVHMKQIAQLDAVGMIMLEQPFRPDDLQSLLGLKKVAQTPVCLDEGLHDPDMLETLIALGAIDIANIKVGRVGGLAASLQMHRMCKAAGIPLWCGRRTGAGISLALEVALAALPQFSYPTDHGVDLLQETLDHFVDLSQFNYREGTVSVPTAPGIGVEVDTDMLAALTLNQCSVSA